jgi:glutathione S-transferase
LLPTAPAESRRVRLLDRLFDTTIHAPFQWIVAERMRPPEHHDPFGVEKLQSDVRRGYDAVAKLVDDPWAAGEAFTLADCAALPALYYADYAIKLAEWPTLAAYLERLKTRPSVARVLTEAEPWFQYFPLRNG